MLRELPRRTRLLVAAALLAGAATTIVGAAVLLSQRQSNASEPASLDDAVAVGILDQEVLDTLRVEGQAVGIVSLDWELISVPIRANLAGQLDTPEELDAGARLVSEAKRHLLALLGDRVTVERDYEDLTNVVIRFESEEALLLALRVPIVTAIRANRALVAFIKESRPLVGQPEVDRRGYRGKGTYVAVIDGGVDSSDSQWFPAGSVEKSYRAAGADGTGVEEGHGTHVASTVLAMAPDTRIIAVDVFHRGLLWLLIGLEADATSILDGVQHVIGLKEAYLRDRAQCCNVVAMNLSLGRPEDYQRAICTDDYSLAKAFDLGIVPVVAAGNDARDDDDVFHPGIGRPSCAERALSVGATTDGVFGGVPGCYASPTSDVPASFSQVGETLQILAPGSCIVAAGGAMQGTSMAAPHVAGAVAVLAGAKPEAAPSELWSALTRSGTPITDARISPPVRVNRLDIADALDRLLSGGAAPSPTPASDATPPAVSAPVAVITSGLQAQPNGHVTIRVSWTAKDDAGVAGHQLRMREGEGDWRIVPTAPGATSVSAVIAPGTVYRFAASAQDAAGNDSGWIEGPALTLETHAEDDGAVTYGPGAWTTRTSAELVGGAARAASEADAQACLKVSGRYVAWLATMQPDRGAATVWFDGVQVATIDLGAVTRPRAVVFGRLLAPGTDHTLCVRGSGTPGRPTIDIDGFAILR